MNTQTELMTFIQEKVAEYLSKPVEDIKLTTALSEYGINSVSAMSLCADIEDLIGIDVEPTLTWNYPTIEKMSAFLIEEQNAQLA
ncbi:acyl carrier protein [Shewanella psychrophila]|uniref:Acyl carrier protein n=1 Tax=Shewanella psychrophila TaxID=225848 RepID=A0A1S6HIU0_9GAMM|nr:acyl carrier protein [Shewanella psychrophila]AQS35441.1 acyl carrier protein [Shewanella psychrophila]